MPSRNLPTLTRAEVESHNSDKSCYVTVGTNVYDVTDFVQDHPGGADLILGYAGKDVEEILRDEDSHAHSEAAYEVLDDSLVGFLASSTHATSRASKASNGRAEEATQGQKAPWVHPRTGMSCAEDLSRETDVAGDYKTHKFLDLSRPLFPQVWYGGFSKDFYLDQVHRPRHYRGGESAPLFGNFLEPLTKTPWWLIPTLWLPPVAYGTYVASQGVGSALEASAWWVFGLGIWTFIEYFMHRFLFHLDDFLPDNRVAITAHFLLHGVHHYLPMDRYRLVMPPVLCTVLAIPYWRLCHDVLFYWSWSVATLIFCGGFFGYICYDLTHYFLHHQNLPLWYKSLKKYHLQHHFLDYENGFGVTNRFWDRVFGTELMPVVKTT